MDFTMRRDDGTIEPEPERFPALGESYVNRNVLDLESARANFAHVNKQLELMVDQANAIEVKDDPSVKQAVGLAGQAKSLSKEIEKTRKAILEEPAAFTKKLNAFCKDFTGKLYHVETVLKRGIGQYQARKELERREAEKKARDEVAKLQARLDKEAEEKGIEKVEVVVPVIPKEDKVARSESGASASVRKNWKGSIIDEGLVPREYLMVDMKKVSEAIKMGARTIPGIEIKEEITTVLRA